MKDIIRGRVFVYGDNIDTDQIYPGRYLDLVDPADIKQHTMEELDPTFVDKVEKGDIIIAGKNFGCGSSREHAPISLISSGISLVIAESFARIFYRNATNLALPLMESKDVSKNLKTGDIIEVNLAEGLIKNETSGEEFEASKISEFISHIINKGGIKKVFLERAKK